MGNVIECAFSLLDTQRKYTGQHRQYVITNARDICYSPETREKISKREALGYYGHGRRVLCGRMDIQEVDVITLPNGQQAMVSNIPSNVTVTFDVDQDGTVKHKQEILNTETGKIVDKLNASKVGGFSWACPGTDGGERKLTTLTGFSGFDYVLTPGFSANRGYILESAQKDMVLESVAAIVGDDKKAEQLVAGWKFEDDRITRLEDAVFESRNAYFELQSQSSQLEQKLANSEAQLSLAKDTIKTTQEKFEGILESIADSLPFFIPENVMHEMLEGDFTRARGIFESAARMDFSQFPLGKANAVQVKTPSGIFKKDAPEYGTAAYGFDILL